MTSHLMFVGTYTQGGLAYHGHAEGIYAFRFGPNGAITPLGLVAAAVNPAFLALHPNKRFLYTCNETGSFGNHKNTGGVSAYLVDAQTAKLTLLNSQPSGGEDPCHITVDPSGKFLLVANYTGGSVDVLPINSDGTLGASVSHIQLQGSGPNQARQEKAHAHCVTLDAQSRTLFVADLGGDKLYLLRFDAATGHLQAAHSASLAPGAGPRHVALSADGRFVYVLNELLSTLTVFSSSSASLDGSAALTEVQTIPTVTAEWVGRSWTAEVLLHPKGHHLYATNRGENTVAIFHVDQKTGRLTYEKSEPTQGGIPRHMTFDPSGSYLLVENQETNTIVEFAVQEHGHLHYTGSTVHTPCPVSIVFL